MNQTREVLDADLRDAAHELGQLISKLKTGECDDDMDIAVRLNCVIRHLRAAWNGRDMTFEDINAMTLEEFDRLGTNPVFGETPHDNSAL